MDEVQFLDTRIWMLHVRIGHRSRYQQPPIIGEFPKNLSPLGLTPPLHSNSDRGTTSRAPLTLRTSSPFRVRSPPSLSSSFLSLYFVICNSFVFLFLSLLSSFSSLLLHSNPLLYTSFLLIRFFFLETRHSLSKNFFKTS